MSAFKFQRTSISNLLQITPFLALDARGYLSKPFEKSIFAEHGIDLSPWEELRSRSHKGVLRGLHFQRRHWPLERVECLIISDKDDALPTLAEYTGAV